MKKQVTMTLLAVGIASVNLAFGQRDTRSYDAGRSGRNDAYRYNDDRSGRPSGMSNEQYERALIDAYKTGYRDGMETARKLNGNANSDGLSARERRNYDDRRATRNDNWWRNDRDLSRDKNDRTEKRGLPYKAFTGGFYVGANSTRYKGEDVNGNALTGRLGYQVGVFTRFGGRIYGQVGAEYFASSSNFFTPGDGQQLNEISGRIDTKWLQIPALVGVKLAQSKRGISGVRLGVGAEYANRLGGSNTVNIDNNEIKSGTFLALGNLGFDIGPLMIDFMYHHGLNDAIKGYNNSQRRSVGVNVGFKF